MTLVKVDSGESGLVIVKKGLMFWAEYESASSKLEKVLVGTAGPREHCDAGGNKVCSSMEGYEFGHAYVCGCPGQNRRRPSHGGWELRLESQKLEPEDRLEPHYYVAD